MGIFGWSLPPGCGTLPGEEDEGPCGCCGRAMDWCNCPECPACENRGDPKCYHEHGMELTQEQVKGIAAANQLMYNDLVAEREWAKSMLEEPLDWPEEEEL